MSLLQKSQSVELSRRTQPFYAKKTSYSLGQQVQIEIDTQREFLDFENARLVFDIVYGASTDALSNRWVAGQTIENLRVKTLSGQIIGHEIRQYRTCYSMFKDLTANNEINSSYDAVMEGAVPVALADAGSTIEYAHRINNHIFGLKDYYPAHFHQGLMIEYDLPSSIDELTYEATNSGDVLPATLTISNPRFVCDLVQLKPEIENEMVRLMEEQKLFIDYVEWLEQENPLTASSSSEAYDVVGIDGRVKSAFTFTIQDADNDGDDEPLFGNYGRNDMTSYRFRLGSRYINYAPIPCSDVARAQQIFELTKAIDYHNDNTHMSKAGDSSNLAGPSSSVAHGSEALNTTRFVVGCKIDKAMKDTEEVISSQVDKDRNNLRVELAFGGSQTAGTIYTICALDKRLQLLPGSIVRNVRS